MDQMPIQFPALRINKFHIERFRASQELSCMSQKFFDQGGFKHETYFIDSEGKKFLIENVTKIRRSWHPAYWFAPSPVFIVDVTIGKPTQLTFEEIKTMVIDLVVKNRWYTQGGENKEKFLKAFERIQSLPELIENISFYGKWQG
ncbi:MAG: hypothetical protein IPN42_06855 [Methylococcaceae bacterium]|nr:hypothetical protein [Methylococcaceae bacterium]